MNMLTMTQYREQFEQYHEKAKKLKRECKHLKDLQEKTIKLSAEAAAKFKSTDPSDENYAQKEEIYNHFNDTLRIISREFDPPPKNRRGSFFSQGNSSESVLDFFTPSKSY